MHSQQTELTTAKILMKDQKNRLQNIRHSVGRFNQAKAIAEAELQQTPQPESESKPQQGKMRYIADNAQEAELLKLAKAEYNGVHCIKTFAEKLNIRSGAVYLALKHHGFIQQNQTTEYRVLDAYYRTSGNLRSITEETGLTVWICAKTLENLGFSPNWASYRAPAKNRSGTNQTGAEAEEEFKRLVPSAIDMNRYYKENNPIFDFIVNDKTIDVKSRTIESRNNYFQYRLRYKKDDKPDLPDFYCLFGIKDKDDGLEGGYHLFLIPSAVISDDQLNITIPLNKDSLTDNVMYWDFEVQPSALAAMLGDI